MGAFGNDLNIHEIYQLSTLAFRFPIFFFLLQTIRPKKGVMFEEMVKEKDKKKSDRTSGTDKLANLQ